MAPDSPHQRTQEQSIKARKHELFEADELDTSSGPRRSFRDCLRETPTDPLSPLLKALLWTVGTIVVLLLVVALATGGNKKLPPRRTSVLVPTASRLA